MDQHRPDMVRRNLIGGTADLTRIAEGHAGLLSEISKWMDGNPCCRGACDHMIVALHSTARAIGFVWGG